MKKLTACSAVSVAMVALLIGLGMPADARAMSIQELMQLPPSAWGDATSGLSPAELRSLHEQFRALPESVRARYLGSRGNFAGRRPSRGPNPTLQYDTGVPHTNRVGTTNSVGNQFNSGFGNPHTLSTVTFQLAGNFAAAGDITVFGAPVGSAAPVLFSATLSGAPINTLIPLPLPGLTNLSGTFLAGVNQSGSMTTINTTFVIVAVDVNSGGFGFHGMSILVGGGGGFNPAPTVVPGVPFNAIIRMTGNNLPVELMDFAVDN